MPAMKRVFFSSTLLEAFFLLGRHDNSGKSMNCVESKERLCVKTRADGQPHGTNDR